MWALKFIKISTLIGSLFANHEVYNVYNEVYN